MNLSAESVSCLNQTRVKVKETENQRLSQMRVVMRLMASGKFKYIGDEICSEAVTQARNERRGEAVVMGLFRKKKNDKTYMVLPYVSTLNSITERAHP